MDVRPNVSGAFPPLICHATPLRHHHASGRAREPDLGSLVLPRTQGTLRPPPNARWLARWLQDNFINSYENLRQGRLYVPLAIDACARIHARRSSHPFSSWTVITSTFSHAQPGHALFNGLTFWFLAPTALAVLGNAQFLMLYLGSASFYSHLSSFQTNEFRSPGIVRKPFRRCVLEPCLASVEQTQLPFARCQWYAQFFFSPTQSKSLNFLPTYACLTVHRPPHPFARRAWCQARYTPSHPSSPLPRHVHSSSSSSWCPCPHGPVSAALHALTSTTLSLAGFVAFFHFSALAEKNLPTVLHPR